MGYNSQNYNAGGYNNNGLIGKAIRFIRYVFYPKTVGILKRAMHVGMESQPTYIFPNEQVVIAPPIVPALPPVEGAGMGLLLALTYALKNFISPPPVIIPTGPPGPPVLGAAYGLLLALTYNSTNYVAPPPVQTGAAPIGLLLTLTYSSTNNYVPPVTTVLGAPIGLLLILTTSLSASAYLTNEANGIITDEVGNGIIA